MAQFMDRDKVLPDAVLDRLKYVVAENLGLMPELEQRGWPEMTSRDCGRVGGKIGGRMVKVMIRLAEESMARRQDAP